MQEPHRLPVSSARHSFPRGTQQAGTVPLTLLTSPTRDIHILGKFHSRCIPRHKARVKLDLEHLHGCHLQRGCRQEMLKLGRAHHVLTPHTHASQLTGSDSLMHSALPTSSFSGSEVGQPQSCNSAGPTQTASRSMGTPGVLG